MKNAFLLSLASLSLAALSTFSHQAHACGGGFFITPSDTPETTSATGHRVVISISTDQTVLWDQIQYDGAPESFAWIYPVKPGAQVQVGSDAWIETLDARTTPIIGSGQAFCGSEGMEAHDSGCACGSADAAGGDLKNGEGPSERDPVVNILHSGTAGPYEYMILDSTTPGTLAQWLTDRNYTVPAGIQPILDDYLAQGYDFIAAKLTPGAGVQQMQPLRVVMPGMQTTFPLRMLAAGARDNVGLVVMVLSESRMDVDNFKAITIDPAGLTWDWDNHTSNYAQARQDWLSQNQGSVFLTNYARHSRFLFEDGYIAETAGYKMIAQDFFDQGFKNKEADMACNESQYSGTQASTKKVVNLCPTDPAMCSTPTANEIDSRVFACGKLDDLAVAMTGLHPANVWLTRLEANLPVSALSQDFVLKSTPSDELGPDITAQGSKGDPCASAFMAPMFQSGKTTGRGSSPLRGIFIMGLLTLAAGATIARRMTRKPAFLTVGHHHA